MEKKTRKLTPEQDALEHILAFRDKSFLEERFIDPIKGKMYISESSLCNDIPVSLYYLKT